MWFSEGRIRRGQIRSGMNRYKYNDICCFDYAALLDYLIGDPWGWPHPVRVMGWVISRLSKFSLQYCQNPLYTTSSRNFPGDNCDNW